MNSSRQFTGREIFTIAIAIHGSTTGAVEALATRLDIDPAELQAYCDDAKPVPDRIKEKLVSLLGAHSTHDTAWRRDEWLIAQPHSR